MFLSERIIGKISIVWPRACACAMRVAPHVCPVFDMAEGCEVLCPRPPVPINRAPWKLMSQAIPALLRSTARYQVGLINYGDYGPQTSLEKER